MPDEDFNVNAQWLSRSKSCGGKMKKLRQIFEKLRQKRAEVAAKASRHAAIICRYFVASRDINSYDS